VKSDALLRFAMIASRPAHRWSDALGGL